jgi:diguanylate cyclase (GGDEF)-like protein
MPLENKRVLVVDDSEVMQRLMQAHLRADGFEVFAANNGSEALGVVKSVDPAVILLDVDMPVMDGHETCVRLKDDPATQIIPVIFVTSKGSVFDKVQGLDLGAMDYVTKPFEPVELRARVRSAYQLHYLIRLLEERAQVDGLTGLHNRDYLNRRLEQEMERCRRYGATLTLVMADIDRFKGLNDTYGHLFGDNVLRHIGGCLVRQARLTDLVARYGGEEFVVLLPEQSAAGGVAFAERVRAHFEPLPSPNDGPPIVVTASFGVACTTVVGCSDVEGLLAAADKALYAAKEAGRDCIRLWNGEAAVEPRS